MAWNPVRGWLGDSGLPSSFRRALVLAGLSAFRLPSGSHFVANRAGCLSLHREVCLQEPLAVSHLWPRCLLLDRARATRRAAVAAEPSDLNSLSCLPRERYLALYSVGDGMRL